MLRAAVLVLLAVLFAAPQARAEFYKWTDRDGREFYTNEKGKVPPEYRHTLTPVEVHEDRVNFGQKTVAGADTKKTKTAEHKDRYGRGEEYWHKRAENLKRQIREQQDELDLLAKQERDEESAAVKKQISNRSKSQKARDQKREKIEKKVSRLKHELEVELPEEARKADAYPGWVR